MTKLQNDYHRKDGSKSVTITCCVSPKANVRKVRGTNPKIFEGQPENSEESTKVEFKMNYITSWEDIEDGKG